MKTKIIPFDLETAKKIQAGEIEGKIVRKGSQKQVCEILEFDAEYQDKSSEKFLIVKVPAHDFEKERLWIYHQDGRAMHSSNYKDFWYWYDLALEVPDNKQQFNAFDKVLVRYPDKTELCVSKDRWIPGIFQYKSVNSDLYFVSGKAYKDCIPYEGNEHLVGTTNVATK